MLLQDSVHLRHLLLVRYEELATNPLKVLTQIAAFLAIEPFAQHTLAQDCHIHERKEAIRDLNAESIAHLTPAQIAAINAVGKPMLRHFGYEIITRTDTQLEPSTPATSYT